MLEGLHDDWVMAGSAREAVFNDLPSGSYRFRLAGTYDGPWVEAQASTISVAPPHLPHWLVPGQRDGGGAQPARGSLVAAAAIGAQPARSSSTSAPG